MKNSTKFILNIIVIILFISAIFLIVKRSKNKSSPNTNNATPNQEVLSDKEIASPKLNPEKTDLYFYDLTDQRLAKLNLKDKQLAFLSTNFDKPNELIWSADFNKIILKFDDSKDKIKLADKEYKNKETDLPTSYYFVAETNLKTVFNLDKYSIHLDWYNDKEVVYQYYNFDSGQYSIAKMDTESRKWQNLLKLNDETEYQLDPLTDGKIIMTELSSDVANLKMTLFDPTHGSQKELFSGQGLQTKKIDNDKLVVSSFIDLNTDSRKIQVFSLSQNKTVLDLENAPRQLVVPFADNSFLQTKRDGSGKCDLIIQVKTDGSKKDLLISDQNNCWQIDWFDYLKNDNSLLILSNKKIHKIKL